MTEPDPPVPDGPAYAALLGTRAWQLDVPPDDLPPPEESPPESPEPPPAEAISVRPTAPPPAPVPPPPERVLEAILFVGIAPLTAERACELVRGLTPEQFRQALDDLNRDYRRQGRPYTIQQGPAGAVLALRPRFGAVRARLFGGPREARLSQAALDVLSLVAYRQPVAKAEVDSLHGAESGGPLRQLVRLGLVVVGSRPGSDPAEVCYTTTRRFLDLFGLSSLDDLPRTGDLQRL